MDSRYNFSLLTKRGERKYLNKSERKRFYKATYDLPQEKKILCLLFHYTGARISEIMSLQVRQIDFDDKSIIIRSLKQRRSDIYRIIPLPDHLLHKILSYMDMAKQDQARLLNNTECLWSFSTRSATRYIKAVMIKAKVRGVRACARGLRHGFAVHAINKVPLTQVQKWMGHADVRTTAIYLDVSGAEERELAQKIWADDQ